ncbi:putative membrane protein [Ehrlichia ruminantium]|uniref:hypothetical protein n=1 Tax=Ehrlichia ruminantium TaxID=779 RepID=UPI0007C121B4|nr:hypothetical protein [Ehrlichia ruminantium]QLK52068.1 hypothetical protein FDZ65_00810 [Ehrlichia ruminantium]QLK53900.1 hypothetical protein FDZ63_00805 [Ehrlichia ruminantium]QLK56651.1 hypothetical protein FDZ60_00805 [Ehrlichia ruminantium]GAT75955.1 putative membrane protein [Ehrlichia ruminantium]
MLFFSKVPKNKIIISVGDHGAIVLNIVDAIVQDKYFIEGIHDVAMSKIISCITEYKKSSIYLVLNHSDQVYTEHKLPASNKITAKSLMKINLNKIMSDYDVGTAFLLTEPNSTNKNWHYMYATSRLNELSKSILDTILSNSGNFCGILLLPIEMASLCNKLLTVQCKSCDGWTVFVAYTKTNDFKHIVLYKGKIVYVGNIMLSDDDTSPGIIAGKIYQEVHDILLSLTKLGDTKESVINLYIITSSSIKTSLLSCDFKNMDSNILTPYELSKILMVNQSANIMSEFCDTVVLSAVMEQCSFMILHTKYTRLLCKIGFINTYLIPFLLCFITVISLLNVGYMLRIDSHYDERVSMLLHHEQLISNIEKIDKDTSIRQVNEMYETMDVYKSLLASDFFSLDLIFKLHNVDLTGFVINYISLHVTDNGLKVKLLLKFNKEKAFLDYYNNLQLNIKNEFKEYKVEVIDSLPDVLDNHKIVVVKLEK